MTAQLSELGMPFSRIDAIDARTTADSDLEAVFSGNGRYGRVSKGDQCCTLSHVRCWETIVRSGVRHALVLEDDVNLHKDAASLLSDLSWLPERVVLLKLESYGPASQRILVGQPTRVADGTSIAPLHSKHTGSGAYIIARELAAWLLDEIRIWTMSIDQMLFNPHVSPITSVIEPYQLIPAIAKQEDLHGNSDIAEWRAALRAFGWESLNRRLRRACNDMRIAPRQAMDLFTGRARLVNI